MERGQAKETTYTMMGAVRPRRKARPQQMVDAMERGQANETTYTMIGAARPIRN